MTCKDVDWEKRLLTVCQAVQRQTGRGLVSEELKTFKSRRLVPLTAVAVTALRQLKSEQDALRRVRGSEWQDFDLVFTAGTGTPLEPSDLRTHYYKTPERVGLPRVRPHDLRHTAASLMAAEEIPAHVIQAMMGHANSATTMNIYTHVAPASYAEARKRLDAAFARMTRSTHRPGQNAARGRFLTITTPDEG